jgi:hypothetical protein
MQFYSSTRLKLACADLRQIQVFALESTVVQQPHCILDRHNLGFAFVVDSQYLRTSVWIAVELASL